MSVISGSPLQHKALLLFKSDLQDQRNESMRTLDKLHHEIRAIGESGPGDLIDDTCGNSSPEALFAMYAENRARLLRIEAALRRITLGEFGICAECGGVIGLKRLRALPWVSNCIECQERWEQGQVHGTVQVFGPMLAG